MTSPEDQKSKPAINVDIWAEHPIIEAEFAKNNAAAIGLDGSRLVRGFVISTITGDDEQIFFWKKGARFSKKRGLQIAQQLNIRLDWEISTMELPEEIRDKLSEVKNQVLTLDMGTYPDLLKAHSIWYSAMKFVKQHAQSSPQLKEDINYWVYSQNAILEFKKKIDK